MFGFGAKRKQEAQSQGEIVTARLNARVQPIDRGDYFEDPLDDVLTAKKMGAIVGGGTQLADEPEGIAFCDLEIELADGSEEAILLVIATLEKLGAPKGSKLIIEASGREIPFGQFEGIAIYLNGTSLPAETYATTDVNVVIEECGKALGDTGAFRGFWEGSEETSLYFYGPSFEGMRAAMEPFLAQYPLCAAARVEQIA